MSSSCFLKDPRTGEILKNRQGIPRLRPSRPQKIQRNQPVIICLAFPQAADQDLLLVKQVRAERRQEYQPEQAEETESTERITALNDAGFLSLTALFRSIKRLFSF